VNRLNDVERENPLVNVVTAADAELTSTSKRLILRLVLIDYPFGEKPHFLSHFDGSCWQLSLHQPAIQGKNKPFG